MAYVVERYLPGLAPCELAQSLRRLSQAIAELQDEAIPVRYLGSTIVPGDEACFCDFEGPSEASIAEVNRRAALPFSRIVPALVIRPAKGIAR
jgi:hypothetical protein